MAKAVFLVEAGHGEKRGRPVVGTRADGKGSGDWNWGQMRARVGGLKAVNTTVGRNIGSTCSFAEAPRTTQKCSESNFTDFCAWRIHFHNSAQSHGDRKKKGTNTTV